MIFDLTLAQTYRMVSSMGTVKTTKIFTAYGVETHVSLASLTLIIYEASCVNLIVDLHSTVGS